MSDDKALTKTEIKKAIENTTGLSGSQTSSFLDALENLIIAEVSQKGTFTLPGILKIVSSMKPATPERTGFSPFTKEPVIIKAKPARRILKLKALKKLKDATS